MAMVLVATFSAGIGAERYGLTGDSDANASNSIADQPGFATLQETWDLIHESYVDESAIKDDVLIYGAAKGMVEALGDTGHSTFLTPEEADAFSASSEGELIGIGVELDYSTGQPVIIAPIDGSPADEAGLRTGDVIVAIDGQQTSALTQMDVFSLLRGDEGASVDLTIAREGEDEFTVTLVRRLIEIQAVTWTMLPGRIAHIRLAEFSVGATDGVKAALKEAKARGTKGVIFDLRDNPGGLVFEAIGVASQFLPEGTPIYQYKERDDKARPIRTVGLGEGTELPLAVLVNKGSASAAEIVASALQVSGRAPLIGETTFGTGTVLTPLELTDGSVLLLGTGLWLAADGEQIWRKGVEPTDQIKLPATVQAFRPSDDANVSRAEFAEFTDVQLLAGYESVHD